MANKQQKDVIREFGLTNLSVRNRTVVIILTILMAVTGFYSYFSMPKEQFPEVKLPTIYIRTPYAGTAPFDIENLVTQPLEQEIKGVSKVKEIKSTSVQDMSIITVEFQSDVTSNKAKQDVKDAVDRAEPELPSDLDEDPRVMEVNTSEIPVMNVNIAGDIPQEQLKEHAEDLQDEFEALRQIDEAQMRGAPEREVAVKIDPYKMQARQVSFNDVETAIKRENTSLSAGELEVENYNRSLRVSGEFEEVQEMGNIIVKHERGNIVYLKDIAQSVMQFQDRTSIARADGEPVISLDIIKQSGENLILAAQEIERLIKEAKKNKLPSSVTITTTNNQADRTNQMLANLESNITSGVILVVMVLLFFLGLRNALFVGVAIPLSMFTAIMLLYAAGVTMNMVVLFALILSLGLLVDNGIVVVENIYRLMEEGYSPIKAAREGAGEVAWAIIASTATTVAVFVPLAFWSGIVGEFMKYLPITLIIVLASSLFVALVINPVLTSFWMRVQKNQETNIKKTLYVFISFLVIAGMCYWSNYFTAGGLAIVIGTIAVLNVFILSPLSMWFQNTLLIKVETAYNKFIRLALRGANPYLFLGGTVLVLILSVGAFIWDRPPVNFFPDNKPNFLNIYVELPVGANIHYTDSVTREVEKEVMDIISPYEDIVEVVLVNVGKGGSHPMERNAQGNPSNKSKIVVAFVEYEQRKNYSTGAIMKKIDQNLSDLPGVSISVEKNRMGPPVGNPINMEISGANYKKLIALSQDIKSYINQFNIPGIEELKSDLKTGKPELLVNIDREKARRFGVSTAQIGSALRTALYGKEVSKFKQEGDDIPIMVRLGEEYRNQVHTLMNQYITFRNKSTGQIVQIPISAIADLKYSTTFSSVKRKDLDRVITLYSNVREGYNANATVNSIKKVLENYDMPDGYNLRFTGEQEEQSKASNFLSNALIIAVSLILFIIVGQFNSILKPVIIVTTVIFSTIGVFLGIITFDMNFVIIMTGIGIISLAGIVVNNAIVLIDYIDLMLERRMEKRGVKHLNALPYAELKEGIIEGGQKRLRPVLLTAITTILGLIPLAVGMNIDFQGLIASLRPDLYFGGNSKVFWSPMAWTVVYGLVFSTFLTLIIVPVMYLLAELLKRWLARLNIF